VAADDGDADLVQKAHVGAGLGFGGFGLEDAHPLLAVVGVEADAPVDEREERPVAADADAVAGVEDRALLADEDVAGEHGLAVAALHAAKFRIGVAAVPRAALALFVCHRTIRRST